MRNKPRIRFKGFTEDWEHRKLNEFLIVSNFQNTENKYDKNDVLSVSGEYGVINQINFQGRSFAGASVSNYGVVEIGDIVYTKSPLKLNPYGIIKTNRFNTGIVSTLYAIYKTKENCDSKFIEHYFNLDDRLNKYLKPLVNKGAKNTLMVSSENALIGEVCFPKVTEQKLIADLLDSLDKYITLHQRKLEKLKLAKKALLQKLFPKNGSKFPELRVKGFTDAWEQRKLSDILKVNSGKDYKHLDQGDIPVYGTGGYMLSVSESLSNIDSIGIGRKGTIDKPQYLKAPFWTVDTLFYLTALDKHSILFLYYLIHLIPWKKFDESTGVPSLSKTTIDNINGYVPSTPKEEELISVLFSKVDKSITLHQCKLDKLQDVKKGLLQKMFV